MTSLVVTVHSYGPRGTLRLELPGEVPLGRVLPELVRVLQLPSADDEGRPLAYQLVHHARLRALNETETLLGAGVVTADELLLVTVTSRVGTVPDEACSQPPPAAVRSPGAWGIEVVPDDYTKEQTGGASRPHSVEPAGGARRGRAVALWSGPAGGTGRTVLAWMLAAFCAERETDTVLLALGEPALSAYLRLPRVPNAASFFESGNLTAAEQAVGWQREGVQVSLKVILGLTRACGKSPRLEQVSGLVDAARDAHRLVVLDLPPLTAGANPWALEPLTRVTDVALVAAPNPSGIAAVVEALATLRDLPVDASLHLVLNRRAPAGLSGTAFTEAVTRLWGTCPSLASDLGFLPDLADRLERGELVEEPRLCAAIERLAVAAAGLESRRQGEG